ncbi:MAG: polysaccharide biosynthesis tyrosine autokinase [Acidobacteria bacterium]|nr:polysaccharide biosynthesis tyrosine autokinase [Acidobacteriota bacterium]
MSDERNQNSLMIPENGRLPAYLLPAAGGGMPPLDADPDGSSMPLSHYLWVFKRHRWKMLAFVLICTIATLAISLRITPIYESTATIDVDRQTPQGVIGQEAVRSTLNDSDQFLATQVRLLQADSVLRPVAMKYGLLQQESTADDRTAAESRQRAGDAPVLLRNLKVTRPPSTYLLLVSYRSSDPQLAADVANAISQSYLEHTYNIRIRSSASLSTFMEKQLDELRAKMERSSMALSRFERELNVINPEEKTSILSARLLQLNTEFTNAQADRVRRDAMFGSVQGGAIEALQTSAQGEDLRRLTERLNEAQEDFVQVKAHYGANHPEFRKSQAKVTEIQRALEYTRKNILSRVEIELRQAQSREAMLHKEVATTKTELDRLNARSFEYQALKREADADKNLYEELVRKIKEAGINAGFQNSSVRLADPARPGFLPVFPNVKLNLALALLLSTVFAFAAALVSDLLDNTVRDPEQVSRTLNTEVIGSLPSVKNWRGRLGPALGGGESTALVRASQQPEGLVSGFDEAVRTLRNSILLSDVDRRLRSLLITSASPSEGKSTMGVHLAIAHAQQGHKTLLIDGDLRKPSVHKRFNLPAGKGLSNVLTTEEDWKSLLVSPEELPGLHVLPAGPPSRKASDLIGRGLEELLAEASEIYDLIILDAPPLLGFAEPLQMASIVDGVIVVTRAGQTDRKAVSSVLNTLRRLRANVLGIVLNEVHQEISSSYYYYGHYSKYYTAQGKA